MFGRAKKQMRERLKKQWGMNPLEDIRYSSNRSRIDKIRIFHDKIADRTEEEMIDEITWADLEMDQVFCRINNTKSFAGEQMLYHELHTVKQDRDWEQYEKQLKYLTDEEDKRLDIEGKLCEIGKTDDAYSLPTFLLNTDLWKIEKGGYLRILQVLLLLFFAASLLRDNSLCTVGLVVVALTNLMVYLYMKQRYEGYLAALGTLKQIYGFGKWMMEDEERRALFGTGEICDDVRELKGLLKAVSSWSGRKQSSMSGDLAGMLSDYLWGITLLDVAAFNRIMKIIDNKQEMVLRLYCFAGEIDVRLAAASYRAGVEEWCIPEFDKANCIRVEGITHPLLERAVANDFVLENRAVITGANASGKSTFMKALAVNMIFAQTIHTCTAQTFCAPRVHVMTCMSLRDDVISGDSYYIREAKYLKRMLDQMESGIPILCVIDEILKGTNTNERLAASAAILDYIAATDCFVLVATHDMELTKNPAYHDFYFESAIAENDIVFDYKIKAGVGKSSNAIALLKVLQYPKQIVQAAEGRFCVG